VAQSHVHGPLWADPSRTSMYMYERIRERASYFASSIPNSQSYPWRSTHSPHAQAVCTGGRSRSRRGRPRQRSHRGGVPLSRAPARPGFRRHGVRCRSTAGWEAAGRWPRGRRQATASAATLEGALPRMAGCGRRCAARMRTASPSSIVLVSRRRRYCQLGMEFDAVKHRFLTSLFFRSSSQPLCDVALGRGVLITC
jgi:hypothetical protein